MVKGIPRNPEKYFKTTPDRFSRESEIENLLTYEHREGIVLDSLDEVKTAIKTYVTQIRSNYEKEQDSQRLIKTTFRDLKKRLNHANEKVMQSKREALDSFKREINLLPNVASGIKRRVSKNLGEVIDLFGQCECLHEGKLTAPKLFDYTKGSLFGGGVGEIKVETTNHKYVISVNRKNPDKNFNDNWFEQELAKVLGKERLIYQVGVKATFNEIGGAWYNIPLLDILDASCLRYTGRGTRQDIVSSSLKRIGNRTNKRLGEKLLENEFISLCLSHKGKRYEAYFKIENLHSHLLPEEIKFNDEIDYDEKVPHRYAKVRGNNLVGPAWTIYRGRKWARVEKPVLDISLSYAGRDFYFSDIPVINEDEINKLIEARNKLTDSLRT